MTKFICRLFFVMFAMTSLCSAALGADWWVTDPLAMPVRPAAASAPQQNPPLFTWPAKTGSTGYELQILNTKNDVATYRIKDNWLHLSVALPQGIHRWRVRALGSALTGWSNERSFTVGAESGSFLVNTKSAAMLAELQRPHPRGFARGTELAALKADLLSARASDVLALKAKVLRQLGVAMPLEPLMRFDLMASSAATNKAIADVRNRLQDEQELLLSLGLLWFHEGDVRWKNEAMARVKNLAAWDPNGSTGRVSHTQASRTILLILAVGFDWFYDNWSNVERSVIHAAAAQRYSALFDVIVADGSLARKPFNSFNSYTLGYLVAAAPLLADGSSVFDRTFPDALSLYAATFPAWSGDDGGYGNGLAYGLWDVPESVVLWDLLRWSTGFSMYHKPEVKNFGKVLAYFLPPGTPGGYFGDGAETLTPSSNARFGKVFAARAQSPLMNWYADQLFGEDKTWFSMMTRPPVDTQSRDFLDAPNSIALPSVGWTAMHSDLTARDRVSVYFKSSSFGSFNHSHADQNSFVIHSRGRVIAMDSGVYDYYNSPHWRNWYKQTRAHNAITFDGGQGQSLGESGTGTRNFAGSIKQFVQTPAVDWVTGDAASAFDRPLLRNNRSVALVRPSTVVIVDDVAADTPKRWESNFHTPSALAQTSTGWEMKIPGAEVCMSFMASQPAVKTSTDGYAPAPETSAKVLPHVWSVFGVKDATTTATFVTVLRMNCATSEPQIQIDAGRVQVKVSGKILVHQAGSMSLE